MGSGIPAFSSDDLLLVVERASALDDRLSQGFIPEETPESEKIASARLDRWCETAARGDRDRFGIRLAADGLDMESARRVLGNVRSRNNSEPPSWAYIYSAVLREIESGADSAGKEGSVSTSRAARAFPEDEPAVRAELFKPFVTVGRKMLLDRSADALNLLTRSGFRGLERYLVDRLSYAAGPVLDLKFDVFRSVRQGFLGAFQGERASGPLHVEFSRQLAAGKWIPLFMEFPVLARLLASIVQFWVDCCAEFLGRLGTDLPAVRRVFSSGGETGRVAGMEAGLSDSHHHGRSAMLLTFESGLRLLYKPKSLEMEIAWFDLLQWLNHEGITHPLKVLKCLSRNGYGWMEHARRRPSGNAEGLRRYYHRSGVLLCLLYLLDGSDFQHENIIPCGNQPVLIDLETLLQPRVADAGSPISPKRFDETVLRTHFLPMWIESATGKGDWVGGLDAAHGVEGEPVSSSEFTRAVIDGFKEAYRFLMERRDILIASDGPLAAFSMQRIRPILLDTSTYEKLRRGSLQPKVLRNGIDRSLELERVFRASLGAGRLPGIFPRCMEEARALERLDIPCFQAETGGTALHTGASERIENYFEEPGYDRVRWNLAGMNERDLDSQVDLIRGAFSLKAAAEAPPDRTYSDECEEPAPECAEAAPSLEIFRRVALEIAESIRERAMFTKRGSAFWVIPTNKPLAGARLCSFIPSDSFFYQGAPGIALFLAAANPVRCGGGYEDLVAASLKPVTDFSETLDAPYGAGIGAASGLGSILYCLVTVGRFLNSTGLMDAALRVATLITPERIARDSSFDLFDGAAGAVLGLLSLYRATSDGTALKLAGLCGEHLLSSRTACESGYRAWKNGRGDFVSGFAHGAAGIAFALLRLAEATGCGSFLDASREAIAFEATLFSPEKGNWKIPEASAEEPVYWTALCNGAPGIGLARIGGLPVLDTPGIQEDIATALQTALSVPISGADHVCCGNFGRIGVLSAAGERLARPDLLRAARKKAAVALKRKEGRGSFSIHPELPGEVHNPGFFRGTAGIGYELLRLSDPDRLPCALLWE